MEKHSATERTRDRSRQNKRGDTETWIGTEIEAGTGTETDRHRDEADKRLDIKDRNERQNVLPLTEFVLSQDRAEVVHHLYNYVQHKSTHKAARMFAVLACLAE